MPATFQVPFGSGVTREVEWIWPTSGLAAGWCRPIRVGRMRART
jgi:hypothetical protein